MSTAMRIRGYLVGRGMLDVPYRLLLDVDEEHRKVLWELDAHHGLNPAGNGAIFADGSSLVVGVRITRMGYEVHGEVHDAHA